MGLVCSSHIVPHCSRCLNLDLNEAKDTFVTKAKYQARITIDVPSECPDTIFQPAAFRGGYMTSKENDAIDIGLRAYHTYKKNSPIRDYIYDYDFVKIKNGKLITNAYSCKDCIRMTDANYFEKL